MPIHRLLIITALICAAWLTSAQAQQPRPVSANAVPVPAAPQLGARSYVLMDFHSGRLLVSENPDERVEP